LDLDFINPVSSSIEQKEDETYNKIISNWSRFIDCLPCEDMQLLIELVSKSYLQEWRLVKIYDELKNDFPIFFYLYRRIKKEGLSKDDITELVENQQDLKFLEKRVEIYLRTYKKTTITEMV
jgi:hypothetical protein